MTSEAWIDTVRIAKDFGTISELFPPGLTDLRDLPYKLFDAIRMGLMFASFDELEEDERPPRHIWLDEELLSEHFAWVKKHRKEKYSSDSKQIEDPVENDAARALISGL